MWKAPANSATWPSPETLITTRQLANLLGVQPGTVRDWKQAGTGPPPASWNGRQTRYRAVQVREWVAGNIRPVRSAWMANQLDEVDPRDDRGRELLSQARSAARRGDHREVARLKRKVTARARFFAAAGTTPGDFEEELAANEHPAGGDGKPVIDAEFEEGHGSASEQGRHDQAPRQQLLRVTRPFIQLAKPRQLTPGQRPIPDQRPAPASLERDRQLLEEFLALSPGERPAF
jgi:hypothetical protein